MRIAKLHQNLCFVNKVYDCRVNGNVAIFFVASVDEDIHNETEMATDIPTG